VRRSTGDRWALECNACGVEYAGVIPERILKGNTPAMANKLSDHVWTINELIEKAMEA